MRAVRAVRACGGWRCTDDGALYELTLAVAEELHLDGRALDLAEQVAQGRVLVERDGEVIELLVERPRRLVADRRHQTCTRASRQRVVSRGALSNRGAWSMRQRTGTASGEWLVVDLLLGFLGVWWRWCGRGAGSAKNKEKSAR